MGGVSGAEGRRRSRRVRPGDTILLVVSTGHRGIIYPSIKVTTALSDGMSTAAGASAGVHHHGNINGHPPSSVHPSARLTYCVAEGVEWFPN